MGGWLENRKRMRLDIIKAFSAKTGIGAEDFARIFYDPAFPPLIGDFDGEYISDADVLDETLSEMSRSTVLPIGIVRSYFSRKETFAQFGEHLLRAGAYSRGTK
ncbi:MAG: hypothetical protein PHD74_04785 [Candidatus Krumholzibacteria bacterium]|nr:hypothetical protein [Candidatus Krumholzibacteria bacterium]